MSLELRAAGPPAEVEDRLAVRCRLGDPSAFDELVARYQARLYRFAMRALQNRGEAEDAVQETFVRAYRGLGSYRPDGYFASWIYRIALNECRRRLRSRRPTGALETVSACAEGPTPEQAALDDERHRRVRGAVDALPEPHRVVVTLFYFDEMSVEQIARTLSISAGAVKVRLHRARERLATRLGPVVR
ncbi:MAG: sigma-70 family RNA polymerase sigma factor [Chthonomonadales bacterium]|nr:sigma-70 family RNA polymerase sigma factor [Chthonomonadales bacterium]